MSSDASKNPDYLLSLIKKSEARGHEGKLKIFLGMVAGVGKTYAMLQSAQQLKARGIDVVIGIVETHGRKDTEALLGSLEVLPRLHHQYRGVVIDELDLDAILKRQPKVVLVDELAHTNAPGSRHKKRYLDVLELLAAGIDVFTTLNVQHIESRIDTVQDITQVTVHETIPDNVLDRADDVILIDLPPDELLKRLSEGRIYSKDNADLAKGHFFQRGNLTALREIALRVAAERVDRELREYKTLHGIEGVWKAGGRLMVAIFASPYSEILIRWTRRVADLLGVTWIGAHVESDEGVSEEEKRLLSKNIALVKQIGGEVITIRDDDPVTGLLRIAQQNNVTQIIVGKSQRRFWQTIFEGGSLVSRLMRQSGNIDIYAVSTNRAKGRQYLKNAFRSRKPAWPATDIGWLFAIAIGTWLIAQTLQPYIGYLAVGILFLLAVSVAGLFLSRISILILALVFACIHNFFFIPPIYTFAISKPEDVLLVVMFFVAASVMGHLTARLTRKERILRSREDRAVVLYNLAKAVAAAQSTQDIVNHARRHLAEIMDADVAVILRNEKGIIDPDAIGDPKEHAVAVWAFENGRTAGLGTDTLSGALGTYIPVIGRSGVLGVVGIRPAHGIALDLDQLTLVDTFLNQIAAGIEREGYHDRVKSLQVVEETQKLYKSLLDCVSHELKTPLAAIKGSASALIDPMTNSNPVAVSSLGREVLDASSRLQRLVENLLDMTRIESGLMTPRQDVCDVSDIVGTLLRKLDAAKGDRSVKLSIDRNLPPVLCDPILADQAISNILHNAFAYTPAGTHIDIGASEVHNTIEIRIRDHGPGLPKDRPEQVFDKFYRGDPQRAGGVGIGLSIARGFIEAQGGTLSARNHPGGGAEFVIHLPKGPRTPS